MNIILKLSILTAALLSSIAQAGLEIPKIGSTPKTKITLTEAQIQAIKNEMHGPAKKKTVSLFEEKNSQDLQELLQARLHEAADITHFRDHKSFDTALTFTGLALQAWNPELRHTDIKTKIVQNIIDYGFVTGFIFPTMALMDKSYAIGNHGFGDLLNTMLSDISPKIASALKEQYGVPTEFNGRNFSDLSKQGRKLMWTTLLSQLDPDFYQEHYKKEQPTESARLTLPKEYLRDLNIERERDFINININGDRTAIAHYLKKIGRSDTSESLMQRRRLFQSSLGISAKECAAKCMEEILKGGNEGVSMGGTIGEAIGKFAKPLKIAGYVLGAAHGVDKCIASSECGGTKEQRDAEKAQKEAAAKEKEAQDKIYRETMDEYRKQEAAKQLEADKTDAEKMKHLQKMKEDYEKQPKEHQENDDDAETDDESSADSYIHERNGRDIKPMMNDEEGPGVTFEDVQKMKKAQGMPMVPDEVGSEILFSDDQYLWVTKVMEKESNSQPTKVNVVYPTNPNSRD